MGRLEALINQFCPNGVDYMPLGEVCDFRNGFAFKSDLFQSEGSPIVRITNITGHGVDMEDVKFFHMEDYPKTKMSLFEVREGDVLVAMSGATTGKIGVYKKKETAYLNQRTGKFLPKPGLNNRFLYHFLLTQVNEMYRMAGGGAQPNLSSNDLKTKIEIPIPPLPVQEEIVRVLDTFTELQAELQAELQKRLQQYNYYRDNLLSFEGRTDVEWKKLGDIASIKTGRRFVRTDVKESGVPCFHYGDLYTYYGLTATQTKGYLDEELAKKLRFAKPNDVVVVCAGENDMDLGVGVAWLGKEPAVVHDACCILHHNQNPRYISHFLRTHNYHLQMKKYVKNGKISSLPASGLAEALIPIPSLEEQERIASILDRFDALTRDLSQGLPAEIEKRRQQYEYYRDKLLTFKRN